MKAAMKSGDKETLLSLRLLLSEIKNFEIDNGEQDDAGVQKLIGRSIKQWKDALSDYQKGGREDLVQEAQTRIQVLEQFMPEQASEEDVKKVIEEVIAGLPEGARQKGPVIGQVMKRLAGTADGGMVARLVGEALS